MWRQIIFHLLEVIGTRLLLMLATWSVQVLSKRVNNDIETEIADAVKTAKEKYVREHKRQKARSRERPCDETNRSAHNQRLEGEDDTER